VTRSFALALLFCACGRTDLAPEGDGGVDAGVRDAGVVDAGPPPKPRWVFKGDERCPFLGAEADLTPGIGEQVALVSTRLESECSGAGGEWIIGHEVGGAGRDFAFGGHACYFFPPELTLGVTEWFAVVRVLRSSTPVSTPTPGWCVTTLSTSWLVRSWGLYATEAEARAAFARF
jgi:hypothetical protein